MFLNIEDNILYITYSGLLILMGALLQIFVKEALLKFLKEKKKKPLKRSLLASKKKIRITYQC